MFTFDIFINTVFLSQYSDHCRSDDWSSSPGSDILIANSSTRPMLTTQPSVIWVPWPCSNRSVKLVTHVYERSITSACMCLQRCGAAVPELIRALPGVIAIIRDLMYCNMRNCDALAKHVVLSQFLLHSLTVSKVLINIILLFPRRSSQFPLSSWFHVHDTISTVPCLFKGN